MLQYRIFKLKKQQDKLHWATTRCELKGLEYAAKLLKEVVEHDEDEELSQLDDSEDLEYYF